MQGEGVGLEREPKCDGVWWRVRRRMRRVKSWGTANGRMWGRWAVATSVGHVAARGRGGVATSGSAEVSSAGFSIWRMQKTTSRKLARARLLERQQAAAAAREARERANIGDLTEFTVRAAQADEVDEWLAGRIEKLKAEAERRRQAHRVAAGKALHAMRLRGESVSAIAAQTGLSLGRVARVSARSRRRRNRYSGTGRRRRLLRCPAIALLLWVRSRLARRSWAPSSRISAMTLGSAGIAKLKRDRRWSQPLPLRVDPIEHCSEIERFRRANCGRPIGD